MLNPDPHRLTTVAQAVSKAAPARRGTRDARQGLDALHAPEALLRIEVVTAATGRSASTIARMVRRGEFPAPVKSGARCTRWPASAVRAWLAAQVAQAGGAQV